MATAAWQPEPAGLQQLVECLQKLGSVNAHSTDSSVQKEVTDRLDSFNRAIPDYACYLAHILCFLPNLEPHVRSLAGLILKTNLRELLLRIRSDGPTAAVAAAVLAHVKDAILTSGCLADESHFVRQSASSVIATIMLSFGAESWPEAIEKLLSLVDSGPADVNAVYGGFLALSKICEDVPRGLEAMAINGTRVVDVLIPRLIQHLSTSSEYRVRIAALKSLNPFIPSAGAGSAETAGGAMKPYLNDFVQALFRSAADRNPEVRKNVCMALVALLGSVPDVLMPNLGSTVDFMLYSTQDEDEDVALEACEFWLAFAEEAHLREQMAPYLPKILPVLLKGMIYSEDELLTLDNDEDDEAVPDREQDIKPRFYGNRAEHSGGVHDGANGQAGAAGAKTNGIGASGSGGASLDDEEEEEDDDDLDDSDEEGYDEWNLRKCAAAALDVIAVAFGDGLLAILLPHLKEFLYDPLWTHKEAGILALGAIAEGCEAGMEPHLPLLVPMMLDCLKDRKALVRSIACWALGRYASWVMQLVDSPEHRTNIFLPTLSALLERVLDSNKRVQEAACSAFATLEEEAGSELELYLEPILQGLVRAFPKYQAKNMLILYDAVGTLADAVGLALARPELLNILMPPIIDRWQQLNDFDSRLIPLLECVSSIAIAIGPAFSPYVGPVFERCVRIVRQSLDEYRIYVANPANYDEPDKTFLIVALDLLSALTQGMGPDAATLFAASEPQVWPMLGQCLSAAFPEPAVRQSAFALVGDCAISIFDSLRPQLDVYLGQIEAQIDVDGKQGLTSVCNNAAWAAGEIAVKAGPDMSAWVEPLLRRLVRVLCEPATVRSLRENSAVTIGRLALACPDRVAPGISTFIKHWCAALAEIRDNDEKDSAFRGLCLAIEMNPSGLNEAFAHWLNAVGRWQQPSPELRQQCSQLLVTFKGALGPQMWEAALRDQTPQVVERLRALYGV